MKKKKIKKFSVTPSKSTLKYGSENNPWMRGLSEHDTYAYADAVRLAVIYETFSTLIFIWPLDNFFITIFYTGLHAYHFFTARTMYYNNHVTELEVKGKEM